MANPEYLQWLARGRAHQAQGRPVDALTCYRRAIRLDPATSGPHLHLGEVLWQLGRLPDAIAAWETAARLAPRDLAASQALAEAHLGLGELAAANEAARRALDVEPGNPRALAFAAVTELMLAHDGSDVGGIETAAARLSEAWGRDGSIIAAPALAGMLARALDGIGDVPALMPLRTRVLDSALDGAAGQGITAVLLAQACERAADIRDVAAADRLFDAAIDRSWTSVDRDALRRIARAASKAGSAHAHAVLERYAVFCATTCAPAVPLVWPIRAEGARPRVVALVGATRAEPAVFAALEELGAQAARVDVVVVIAGAVALPAAWPLSASARNLRVLALPPDPDFEDAKRLAALDLDLLIDLAGLDAPVGRLLALRPARLAVSPRELPGGHLPPLVDALPDDLTSIAALLGWISDAVGRSPSCGVDPDALAAIWNAAVAAHQAGDRDAALRGYSRVLELQPGFAPAHFLSAVAHREAGDLAAAAEHLGAAIAAAPRYTDAIIAAGRVAIDRGDAAAAASLCRGVLSVAGPSAPVLRTLGLAHLAQRDGAAAAVAFEDALRLEPFDGETHYNHGVALQMQRNAPEAARAYQRALFFAPDMTAADFNLGVLFQEQRAYAAAEAAYEAVLHVDPGHVAAYKNLGEVLFAAGRIDGWLANFERFEAHCPTALPLAVQALEACQYLPDFDRLERYLEGLRQEKFIAADETELADCLEQILFLLLYFDVEPQMIHQFARTYELTARRVYGEPLPCAGERRPGRLRIGYLSADLRDHVMGKMAWSAVEHSDKSRFELFFYSLSNEEDDWTARFRGLGDRYEVIAHLDERNAAQRIAADDLDILVDLGTHTKGSKPGILALKPARVQITHVASAGTVGLEAIDFKLTDRFADVPENQEHMTERLLPMEGCVYPYRHIVPAVTNLFERSALGIATDAFVVGAFVNAMKLSRRCLRLWRDVLQRIPRAVIAFSPLNAVLRMQYARLAEAAGIRADRIVFLPQGRSEAENQARYSIVDIVLDTMPYGGVNGTLEALDMGVPVVTLVGRRHGERTSYSILKNLGVEATVAHSGRDYVELAVRLAQDRRFMADVRAAIRAGIAGSALTDRVAHTRALERAYVDALARVTEGAGH